MALYDLVRDLPLEIDGTDYEIASHRDLARVHAQDDHDRDARRRGRGPRRGRHLRRRPSTTRAGSHTRAHGLVDARLALEAPRQPQPLPAGEPGQAAYRDYRRWAFESSALDLALQQAGLSLGDALGREARPLTFVSSTRAASLDGWLALYPELRFKLDPTPEWTDELVATLAARGNVDVVDLKGAYHGTVVDNPAEPGAVPAGGRGLSGRAGSRIPAFSDETDAMLEPHRDRITWDAPIHSWADVEALPFAPRCLNSKPSRFGPVARLFEFYDRCAEARDRALRRRPVRARRRARADPAARGAVPSGRLERRRAGRLQRARAAAGPPGQPARPEPCSNGIQASRIAGILASVRWLLITSVVAAAGISALSAAAAQPPDPCVLISTTDASTVLGATPPKAKPKTVGAARVCTYTVKKKTMTVQTSHVATQTAFDKAAKTIKGIVVPVQAVGADTWSANGTTLLVWKNGTAITIKFVGVEPFVAVQQSLAKTASGRL